MVTAAMKLKKTLAAWKGSYDKPRQGIKKQRQHSADKHLYSQSYDGAYAVKTLEGVFPLNK